MAKGNNSQRKDKKKPKKGENKVVTSKPEKHNG